MDGRYFSVTNDVLNINEKNRDHGSAVSGIIAALTGNGKGISGINWKSKLVAERYATALNEQSVRKYYNVISKEKVKLINNSWKVGEFWKTYQKISQEQGEHVLHVWAAGNDGSDVLNHNGVLHVSNGKYAPLGNVVVVASHLKDGKLARGSNYGKTVDIAAPTGMKAPKGMLNGYYKAEDENDYGSYSGSGEIGGFIGTSASAPVVTGVASLIFSVNPKFSPSDVKKILISSATKKATHRHTSKKFPGPNGETNQLVKLAYEIPILNAAAALKLADDIKKGKIAKVTHSYPDPFRPQVLLTFGSGNPGFSANEASFALEGTVDGLNWIPVYSDSVQGQSSLVDISPEYARYRVTGSAVLEHLASGVRTNAEINYEFDVSTTSVAVHDMFSGELLKDSRIRIEPMQRMTETSSSNIGTTDQDGTTNLFLLPGSYKVFVNAPGYNELTKILTIEPSGDFVSVDFPVTPSYYTEGMVIVKVTDAETAQPVSSATIVSDIGNNVITASSSVKAGIYAINVPAFVDYLLLRVEGEGYVSSIVQINRSEIEQATTLVREVSLRKSDASIVFIEGGNLLYHLGNDVFAGSVNSQLQKGTADGVEIDLIFEITGQQMEDHVGARIYFQHRGVQSNIIKSYLYLNGIQVGYFPQSNIDGSFKQSYIDIDLSAGVVKSGKNEIKLTSSYYFNEFYPNGDNYDDFEITGLYIELLGESNQGPGYGEVAP